MISKSFHIITGNSRVTDDFEETLRHLGFSSTFAHLRKMLAEELTHFGIATPRIFDRETEVYISADQKKAVLSRKGHDERTDGSNWFVDLLILSQEAPVETIAIALQDSLKTEILEHSHRETNLIKAVRDLITATSPNGRLLEKPEIQEAAKVLRDDSIRDCLKEF